MSESTRFDQAISAIDALNAADPRQDPHETGDSFELAYSKRMSAWLERLQPDASEVLQLAVRAQHIARWQIPRKNYPKNRAGYKKWRSDLAEFHAKITTEILYKANYDAATIARVQSLLKKKNLKADPECQTLEDVVCLVFLETYFSDFAVQHDEEKLIRILQKTWAKMSNRGHEAALKLPLTPELALVINKALTG